MLGYNPTGHVETQTNFNNVSDRRYYTSIGDSPACGESIYGAPRNVMGSVKYTTSFLGLVSPQDCCRVVQLQLVDSRQLRLTAIDP